MADDGANAYAECIRYLFSNADYSGTAKRYQNPTENWARFDAVSYTHLTLPTIPLV